MAKGRYNDAKMRRTAGLLGGLAVCMVLLSFAAVPLYRIFCQVTGFGGTIQRAETAPSNPLERRIQVRFDANVAGELNWRFVPEQRVVDVQIGETVIVNYIAENIGSKPSVGTATYNVTPEIAGSFFNKLACFCFTEQELKPGQKVLMPVQFFIDPDLVKDPDANRIPGITLSYTFFGTERSEASVLDAEKKT